MSTIVSIQLCVETGLGRLDESGRCFKHATEGRRDPCGTWTYVPSYNGWSSDLIPADFYGQDRSGSEP